jgi:3-hydroxyisobutyrate dehydrogenase-like beta-hydroxyacid dehydrogenase
MAGPDIRLARRPAFPHRRLMVENVTLVGFGEAGQAFVGAEGWQGRARVYDKLTDDSAARPDKLAEYRRAGVEAAESLAAAVGEAGIVLSLVTAGQALAVARDAAPHLAAGMIFCDMNSVAPGTKREAAAVVGMAGGLYVDIAIMSPVNPARLGAPLLLSGGEAPAAARELARLGFADCRVVGPEVGQASAIKMIRSVMVKGIEALTAECLLAADAAGVAEEVLASLDASDRAEPWAKRAAYNLDRMIVHGLRRADEMDEAVKTLEDLGVEPALSRAAARRQREIGGLRLGRPEPGLAARLDQINGRKARAA